MVVDDGEIALLEADHAVRELVRGRQRVGLVAGSVAEALDLEAAERDLALQAAQREGAVAEPLAGVGFGAVGLSGFGVADDLGAVDADDDVVSAHGDLEPEPLPVFGQRAVEVADRGERPALARAVDGAVAEEHVVARLAVGVETQRRFGTGLTISQLDIGRLCH